MLSLSILLLTWGFTGSDVAFAHHKEGHDNGGGNNGNNGNGNNNEDTALAKAEKAIAKAELEAQKLTAKIMENTEKSLGSNFGKDVLRNAVIEAVDEIIDESVESDVGLDKTKKEIYNIQQEFKKGILVEKVSSKLSLKKLDAEYYGKPLNPNYFAQIEKIEQQLIKDIQKVKLQHFEKILYVHPGTTVANDHIEDKFDQIVVEVEQQKNPGILVKKTDKHIKKLLQNDDSADVWKYGIDSSQGKTRIVLELSHIDPATLEKFKVCLILKYKMII